MKWVNVNVISPKIIISQPPERVPLATSLEQRVQWMEPYRPAWHPEKIKFIL